MSCYFIQVNHIWSSLDDKSFVSAHWNNGLAMYIYYVLFWGVNYFGKHEFSSVLEPGTDGNCVAILYIRDHKPSWKMIPCGQPILAHWFCKYHPKTRDAIHNRDYPSLLCVNKCLLTNKTCYQYAYWASSNNYSINVGVMKRNILYFNRNLANHGAKLSFMDGGTFMKISWKGVQGGLTFQYYNVSFRSSGVKIFRLRKSDIYSAICGPTMQPCLDGSCRIQLIICMSDFKCAPRLCACTTDNIVNYDMNYCRHQCPPGICACGPLMFQCSIGGCVPYSHVCDNKHNCMDSSDEFCSTNNLHEYFPANTTLAFPYRTTKSSWRCFDFLCSSGLCIDVQLVNDFVPDCIDGDDESHSLSLKYEGVHRRCKDVQEIPCVPGHSQCFAMESLCVYDRDNLGHVDYCRDGSHLRNCTYIQCTNTFKCPQSYCIPIRKVCDGIYDCHNGEDEIDCHDNICLGYLKCSEVEYCIHPMEVCDGYSHCPQGDDEELCDIQRCPTGCICLGRGVVCRDEELSYMPAFPFQEIIYLSIGSNFTRVPKFSNLSSLSKLVILDLSSSMVINICPALQEDYTFYLSLRLLYLEHNYMNYLSSSCFTKLLSLLVINLHGNPLVDIADDAFKDISLNILILSNSLLSSFSGQLIRGFKSLETLDKRGVELNYWNQSVVDSLNELEIVYTDDTRICCFLKNAKGCQDGVKKNMKCSQLLSHQVMAAVFIVFTVAILLFIMLSMWFATKLHAGPRPVQWLLLNTVLINKSLCVFYVLAIATIDVFHGKYSMFWFRSEYNQCVYQILSILFSSGMMMSNIASACFDHITYKAVSSSLLLQRKANLKVKKIVLSLHFLVITGFTLFTIFISHAINHRLSTRDMWGAPLGVSFNVYDWGVTGPLFLSLVIFLAMAYSLISSTAIFKYTYSSGKRLRAITSTETDIDHNRLFKVLRNLFRYALFRSIECLPIVCIILLKVCGADVALEAQLLSVIASVIFGCIGQTVTSVWYPVFKQRQKTNI